MKMMNKFCALMLSVALCAGMAAPAFAYGGEPTEEVEQPVLTSTTDEEDSKPEILKENHEDKRHRTGEYQQISR